MSNRTVTVTAPADHLAIEITAGGTLTYRVLLAGRVVVHPSPLGIAHDGARFDRVAVTRVGGPHMVEEEYELIHGKRRRHRTAGWQAVLDLSTEEGRLVQLVVRAHDDAVAFRYRFPRADGATLSEEMTGFRFGEGEAWLQPHDPPGVRTPAYEALYTNGIPIGTSTRAPSWNLPALFHTAGAWVLVAESDLGWDGFGAHLGRDPSDRCYRIVPPEAGEGAGVGDRLPRLRDGWQTPWRVLVVGETLATVVESNAITDLAASRRLGDSSWVRPGRVSWSWWSDHDSPKSMIALYEYVDLAEAMGWEHTLVDANWTVHAEDEIRGLIDYAAQRGVGVFFWYNSGGPHNEVTEEPRDRMHEREVRRQELATLSGWGAAGIKVDFFQSDKPAAIGLMWEILRDAADHRLMVNFHGCTVPRGWSRTWPHLMTVEAVGGAERYAFSGEYPQAAAWHNTVLPYTRNVVGPMDYTPVTISHQRFPHFTTTAHELALAVLFESGLQHYADRADTYLGLPDEILGLLRRIPAVWDEARHVDGFPGSHSVLARRGGRTWYVAGIAGQAPVDVDLDLAEFGTGGLLVCDGRHGRPDIIDHSGERLTMTIPAQGGFLLELGDRSARA